MLWEKNKWPAANTTVMFFLEKKIFKFAFTPHVSEGLGKEQGTGW